MQKAAIARYSYKSSCDKALLRDVFLKLLWYITRIDYEENTEYASKASYQHEKTLDLEPREIIITVLCTIIGSREGFREMYSGRKCALNVLPLFPNKRKRAKGATSAVGLCVSKLCWCFPTPEQPLTAQRLVSVSDCFQPKYGWTAY